MISIAEKKMISCIEKNQHILAFVIVSILGFVIRTFGFNFISDDMANFLIPWFYEIREHGGVLSLNRQVGDYNLLYQTLISFGIYFDWDCVIFYKIISIVFDYTLAVSVACLVTREQKKKFLSMKFQVVYAIVLLLPTVILNSAYWGQCDSIYTTFLVLLLMFLYDDHYCLAFIMLGIGLSFKLQTMLIVPFIICYYLCIKRFSLVWFALTAFVFWGSGIVAFIYGRGLTAPFEIYMNQTDIYHQMYMNISSFWILLGDSYEYLKDYAVLLTMILCGIEIYIFINLKKMNTVEEYISLAVGFLWTCLLFLPAEYYGSNVPLFRRNGYRQSGATIP